MANQVDIIIRAVDKGVKKTFGDLAGKVKKSKTALDAFNQSMRKTNSAASALTGRLSAAFAGIGTGLVGKSLWDAGTNMQRLNLAFEAVSGSTDGAAAEIAYVRKEAERLGIVFYESAEGYKQMFAAGVAGGMSAENTRKIFSGVAEAISAMGLNAEQSTGAIRAVGQMMGKTKVMAEELRQQLGEKMATAIQDMAEAYGGDVEALEKAMAAGEVRMDTLIKWADVLHGKYGPAAEKAAGQAVGTMAKFKTAWFDLKVAVSDSGFLTESVSMLKRMTKTMKDPKVIAALREWSTKFFEMAGSVTALAWEWKKWIAGVLTAVVAASILGRIAGFIAAINSAMVVMTGMQIGTYFSTMVAGLKSVELAAMSTATALGAAAGATLALYGGYKIGEWLTMHKQLKAIADQEKENKQTSKALNEQVAQMSRELGLATTSLEGFRQAEKDGVISFDDAAGKWVRNYKQVADAAGTSAKRQEGVTEKALGKMKREYQKYADEIKKLQDDISGRESDLAGDLRSMGRGGMSGLAAWKDLKSEAEEYEAAAEKALKAGDYDSAVSYADRAKAAYKELSSQVEISTRKLIAMKQAEANAMVKSGWSKGSYKEYLALQKEIAVLERKAAKEGKKSTSVAITSNKALKESMQGVESSGKLAIEALKGQKEGAEKEWKTLGEKIAAAMKTGTDAAQVGLDGVKDGGVEMGAILIEQINKFGVEAATEFDAIESYLRQPHEMVITRKYVDKQKLGGVVGAAMMAAGGRVKNAMSGFHFPGYGGGDRPKNLVMAEDGEVMIRKEMVKRAGLKAALAFNSGRFDILLSELMARFSPAGVMMKQMGGLIAPVMPVASPLLMSGGGAVGGASSGRMSTMNVNLNLPTAGPPIQTNMNSQQANELVRQIKRMGDLAA